jgi:hypothetical protein
MTGFTFMSVLIGELSVVTILNTNVPFQVKKNSSGSQKARCAVCGCDVTSIAVDIALIAAVDRGNLILSIWTLQRTICCPIL